VQWEKMVHLKKKLKKKARVRHSEGWSEKKTKERIETKAKGPFTSLGAGGAVTSRVKRSRELVSPSGYVVGT